MGRDVRATRLKRPGTIVHEITKKQSGRSVSTRFGNLPPLYIMMEGDAFARALQPLVADVEPGPAEFMGNAQVPWGLDALNGEVTKPVWKVKPSWYLVATDDKMIPVPAQRMMANRAGAKTVDQVGSHAVYVSQPQAVAEIIKDAARGVSN